ncbi:DUF1302 domain-containing protein [Pelagibacteraceae bacterium]|nr:DUF1302 domain-containing protein [Pelagibacteraceae bacterium]
MNIKNIKVKILSMAMAFVIAFSINAYAQEINTPGFSGTINNTITSGFSVRASERNCALQDGYKYEVALSALNGTGQTLTAAKTTSTFNPLVGYTKNGDFSKTCATYLTDGYGNLSTSAVEIGNVNSDDGNLNYDQGDVIDATSKVLTEINGTTVDGVGINLSFIGSYNAVNEITTPNFKKLNNDALDTLETDLTLLDAYATMYAGDADITIGRFVTSWGESTFIPVGANGLTTNAIDLTKLRAPGASIKDALIPTEQVSVYFNLGDVGVEAYYQHGNSTVEIDPAGSFFGSEVLGDGAKKLLATTPKENEAKNDLCSWAYNVVNSAACDTASAAVHESAATIATYNNASITQTAYRNATDTEWATWSAAASGASHGSTFSSYLAGTPYSYVTVSGALSAFTSSDTSSLNEIWAATKDEDYQTGAVVEMQAADTKFVEAKDDGQFGIKLNKYFDDIGDGLDVSIFYSNYHSKVPYARIKGTGGILAGDIVGAYSVAVGDWLGSSDGSPGLEGDETAAAVGVTYGLLNGAYGEGICGGLGATLGASNLGLSTTDNGDANKRVYRNLMHNKLVTDQYGKTRLQHDPTTCDSIYGSGATGMPLFISLTPTLAAAVTPLNYAQYQFIYPEDNQLFGMSFNTNVNGTTVQAEVAYRPDFPLATSIGDQINQIGDVTGVSAALTAFGHDTYALAPANLLKGALLPTAVETLYAAGTISKNMKTLIQNVKRSSLKPLTSAGGLNNDFYSTPFINYDVWSFDIGTTTSFSASHPVTAGIGADSSYLLTEIAMVNIEGLDNLTNGFVARNGFNEGSGEHLCLGIYGQLTATELAAVNAASNIEAIDYDLSAAGGVTNLGAAIVDPVFGNGSYCESQMGADSSALSYRIVGGATYNNVANSPWSLSPTFVWSHDPEGYGPSSLGGFTEGRQSLSLGLTARKGDALQANLSYVNQMGDDQDNTRNDMDFISASVSYAF